MVNTNDQQRRDLALKRLKEKNGFKIHAFVYVVVNAMIVLVWLFTGSGFFWPIFVIGFWGIGLVLNGWSAYFGERYTEEQIQREMKTLP